MVDLFRERKWDLVGRRGLWFTIMAISIGICIGALIFRGKVDGSPLNYGIDFTGGGIVTVGIQPSVSLGEEAAKTQQIRSALEKANLRVQVQLTSRTVGAARNQVIVRTQLPKGSNEATMLNQQKETIVNVLRSDAGFTSAEILGTDRVSGVVSKELTQRATLAILLGCLAIIFWIFIRYDFGTSLVPKYGLCAIFALAHDLIILTGAFAIVWWVVDSPFVAAFLTILGYSVHDTIVIFDRIRENVKLRKRPTFAETVNSSLLETLARSVNTVLTVEFVLVALFVFGGVTLRGFAGALIIGITSGAWSSIFIASQLLVAWKNREERARLAAAPSRASRPSPQAAPRKMPKPAAKAAEKPAGALSASAGANDQKSGAPIKLTPEEPVEASAAGAARAKKLRGKKRHRRF